MDALQHFVWQADSMLRNYFVRLAEAVRTDRGGQRFPWIACLMNESLLLLLAAAPRADKQPPPSKAGTARTLWPRSGSGSAPAPRNSLSPGPSATWPGMRLGANPLRLLYEAVGQPFAPALPERLSTGVRRPCCGNSPTRT